uniref:Uncharacterized protein n=1 Tax=Anguilla anguilla TaxID=7936 RepID=A0A0E9PG52_ANGAN
MCPPQCLNETYATNVGTVV